MDQGIRLATISDLKCGECALGKLCLPVGVNPAQMASLEEIVDAGRVYHEGERVYSEGQDFEYVYAVKSGMFKTVLNDGQGSEHIASFHLPGELFGLDALHQDSHPSSVIALGTSSLCAIKYSKLERLALQIPGLQHHLFSVLSKEVQSAHEKQQEHAADQKLATFLFTLSARYKERGYSDTRFNLMMPRRDIANHLNLAPETISRLFKRFQRDGLIDVKRTDLQILDLPALGVLGGCNQMCV